MGDGSEEGCDEGENRSNESSESGRSETVGREAVGEGKVGDGSLELSRGGSFGIPLLLLSR